MSDDGNVKQGPWSNPVNLPGLFDSSGKLGPLPQDSLPYVIEQARLQHLQIKRLTDQLRWRKWPDEKPEIGAMILWDKDYPSVYKWTADHPALFMGKDTVRSWLPIPPDTDQQDNERAE